MNSQFPVVHVMCGIFDFTQNMKPKHQKLFGVYLQNKINTTNNVYVDVNLSTLSLSGLSTSNRFSHFESN